MSLLGSLMGDLEDDPIFGHHMRSMRQMSNMMNSLFDPFGMMGGMNNMGSIAGPNRNTMMPFFPQMPTMNRLLSPDFNMSPQMSYSSSSVISMSAGPDGRPQQVYQATSSTRTGPDGIRETKKTVQDSLSGTKKMAIGHHIGDRAHVIEREKNFRTGAEEEHQEFINLDDNEAEDFDREFQNKARNFYPPGGRRHGNDLLALPSNQPTQHNYISREPRQQQLQLTNSPHNSPSTSSHSHRRNLSSNITPRRGIRSPNSSPLLIPSTTHLMSSANIMPTTSIHPHPYNVNSRKNRSNKRSTPTTYNQH